MAERYGHETHPAESVPLSEAMSALLGECFHCFPEVTGQVPRVVV